MLSRANKMFVIY